MKSDLPKVMHPLAGRPMVSHLMEAVESFGPDKIVAVAGDGMRRVFDAVAPHPTVIQHERLGTAHAVLAAREVLEGFEGDVLILYGDTPLVTAATMDRMLAVRRGAGGPLAVVLGFRSDNPGAYGRLVLNRNNGLEAIVEAKDACHDELQIDLCNSGVMCIEGERLFDLLDKIGDDNAKGERYLTDIVGLARAEGRACTVVEGGEKEFLGINSRVELAMAEALVQADLRARAMNGGATLADPATVYFSHDTKLGRDVTVGPNVVFGPEVEVGDRVEIRAFCHLEGARIETGAKIGPFARLRPGTEIAEGAQVGNFVEIKKASVEKGAKINHLAYAGDARIGAGANIGAGVITCNYNGFSKSFTDIGASAFIGSNTALVAPIKVGDGATVGAGSVVTSDIEANALAVSRAPQKVLKGWSIGSRRRGAVRAKKDGK